MAVIIANASIMPVFWLGSEKRFFVFIIFIVFIFFDDGCVLSDVFFAAAVVLRVVARNDAHSPQRRGFVRLRVVARNDGRGLSDVFFAAAVMIGGLRVVARNDGTLSVMVGCCPTFFLRR